MHNDLGPAFPLGRVIVTLDAKEQLPGNELFDALLRHMRCKLGGMPEENGQFLFQFALETHRVISGYRTSAGRLLVIVTEADRSRTTLILGK